MQTLEGDASSYFIRVVRVVGGSAEALVYTAAVIGFSEPGGLPARVADAAQAPPSLPGLSASRSASAASWPS